MTIYNHVKDIVQSAFDKLSFTTPEPLCHQTRLTIGGTVLVIDGIYNRPLQSIEVESLNTVIFRPSCVRISGRCCVIDLDNRTKMANFALALREGGLKC